MYLEISMYSHIEVRVVFDTTPTVSVTTRSYSLFRERMDTISFIEDTNYTPADDQLNTP